MTLVDGLPSKLVTPVAPEPTPPLPSSPHPATLKRSARKSGQKVGVSDIRGLVERLNIHNASTLPLSTIPKTTSKALAMELDFPVEQPNLNKTDGNFI